MKNLLAAALLLWAAAVSARTPEAVGPKVIYGDDDRLDLHQVRDVRLLELADSTVALFDASDVTLTQGQGKLRTDHYGTAYGLCQEEPFFNQPIGAFCSGSLIAPDVVMTAGHCVSSAERCRAIKFVFGFSVKRPNELPGYVQASDVYGCAELLGREQTGADWALIRLDRRVAGHHPLRLNLGGSVANGDPLFVIGHPAGLPTKVAGGATVRAADPVTTDPETGAQTPAKGFFVANLDTYGGNSGSAVFNARTGLVEGILVRGETDYVYTDKGCRLSFRCEAAACRGEDVTKLSAVPLAGVLAGSEPARAITLGKNFAAVLGQAQALSAQ